ncbi:MAG: hypothetical protein RL660_305 [Bacteroidota bacterium]
MLFCEFLALCRHKLLAINALASPSKPYICQIVVIRQGFMTYKKINNISGWVVCAIACIVYLLTKEKSASFWDCGEFLSTAYKQEVPHSPGAPLFSMIGRIFTLFGGDKDAAALVNTMSALASGFTILFLFWSITHFARRIVQYRGGALDMGNIVAIMGAGAVGALAYTFSDTFWFSAVEGEVYALSSFLTALVFWAILKWEESLRDSNADGEGGSAHNRRYADRWIIFIAYVLGLSIGVHLLNLLAIPAIVMVYYFHRYKVSTMGTVVAFFVGCIVTGVVQYGIIQGIPILASKSDLFFNGMGLPFNMGILIFFILFVSLVVYLMRWAKKNNRYGVHLALLSSLFIMLGYSSFVQVIIRSNADVPIDMTNPDNALSLIKYLQREQYGNTPLMFGPYYNVSSRTGPESQKEGKMEYWMNRKTGKYEELGPGRGEYVWPAEYVKFFPRIWDMNDPRHVQYYQEYLGLGKDDEPTGGDNMYFFINYQMIQMYWRYFMWNYVGRQNDIQNLSGEADHSNWISGIGPIDRMFGHGDTNKLPKGIRDSRVRNELYGLPFILGLIGLFFHIKHDKRNALIVGLLFFFTGAAIVIYLNNVPLQPRERDYAYAGSMYAFAIWIGLGVLQIRDWFSKIGAMPSAAAATLICLLAVPTLMAAKEWDDHDRSRKTLAPDSGRNFLESCEKNAILFTEGDNDTYPLWYLQEIEHVRTDVRVINLSLLGIDWYIDQLHYKTNDAPAVPMRWTSEKYRGQNRDVLPVAGAGPALSLDSAIDNFCNDALARPNRNGEATNFLQTRNLYINAGGSGDSAKRINFTVGGDYLMKNDLAILNIISANFGKRPIYFSTTVDPKHYEGLKNYCVQEGLIFKLTSQFTAGVAENKARSPFNVDKTMDLFMKTFKFGGAERKDVYFDQPNRRMLDIMKNSVASFAESLVAGGRKEDAIKVLDHTMKNISEESYPIGIGQEDISLIYIANAYLEAGAKDKARAIHKKMVQYIKDYREFATTTSGTRQERLQADVKECIDRYAYAISIAMRSDMEYAKELDAEFKALSGGQSVIQQMMMQQQQAQQQAQQQQPIQ